MFIGLLCNHVVYLQKKRRRRRKKNTKTGQNYIVTTITACATVQNEGPASPMEWYFVVSVILAPAPLPRLVLFTNPMKVKYKQRFQTMRYFVSVYSIFLYLTISNGHYIYKVTYCH